MPASPAPQHPATRRSAGMTQLLLLLSGSCMSVLGAVLIAPVLPRLTQAFADTPVVDVLVPLVLTAPALLIALTAPFAGIAVDKIDRKRLLIAAMLAYAVFGTAPLYLDSLGAILASRVLVGLCEGAIMTCCTTLIGDYWSGARRARYLALQTLVATLSATAFLALGGALGASSWRTPFWLYAVAAPLAIPMLAKLWQPGAPTVHQRLPKLPWRELATPCLVTVFGGVVFYALIVELPYVLTEVGVTSTGAIGLVSVLMSLGTAGGALAFGPLAGKTPRLLLPVEFGLSATGFLLVFAAASPALITVGAVLTGFGTGMLLPTLVTWAVKRLAFEQRGRGTGLWTSTLFLGEFASPLAISAMGTATGGTRSALAVLGAVTAVVAVLTAIAVRRTEQPRHVFDPA
ncbi:MFS transporter [Amycolatopsis eburnea]|uniref:MFS transporter n=1 Tax=Amycolatopsis eburnea TaxID=2267691 RepID=A0A427T1P2_9PSEU|nr:MFS transporter [Amycolatopsis eburnea]RSD11888.1 MFS transporter [Amycolatopsis eburnea]